ncbi:hypothetical protein BJ170DRAFT_133676 [Xylariales sp. AK1849]|nr:hypothetical protein BJ170DRAFT_133676 [Xylariales sp. AK1849]
MQSLKINRKIPETLQDLQNSFKLAKVSDARALIEIDAVKESFRQYLNRYLKSETTTAEDLDDWKVIDDYLYEVRLHHKRPGEYAADQCLHQPYARRPHVALFVLRIMRFLKSKKGELFDVPGVRGEHGDDRDFERCRRSVQLLGFLLKQKQSKWPGTGTAETLVAKRVPLGLTDDRCRNMAKANDQEFENERDATPRPPIPGSSEDKRAGGIWSAGDVSES